MKKLKELKKLISAALVLTMALTLLPTAAFANGTFSTGEADSVIDSVETADNSDDLTQTDESATAEGTFAAYVSSSGNDTTGDGSQDNPYATISKAYSAVATGGTIYLLSDVDVSNSITFSTAKTVTITSADSSNIKTIYSKVSFGYANRWFFNVNAGEIIFKNITIDGTYQKNNNDGYYYAPGAVVASKATVTIDYGTTIRNFKKNKGDSGGAAVVKSADAGAVVNIKDGVEITGCVLETGSADDPAAVLSSGTGAILYMTGGTVTGNTLSATQDNTTAVVNIGKVSNPHFWMTGGTITGNTINNGAAAVYMRGEANNCDIQFGDTAYVYGNYVNGTSGDQRNIYLKNNNSGTENSNVYVKLCSALTTGAKLGVYAEKIGMATKVAQGGGVTGVGTGSYTATAKDTTYFVSDKATDAEILYCGGSADTCGLLQHRDDDTNHNGGTSAIYISVSPEVTATKGGDDTITLDISRCNSDATYVVLDKDMKPVTDKTLTGGTQGTNGTFTLADSTSSTISMPGLSKADGPYTVMLVSGSLFVGSDGKARTDNLTDIATVNIVNFAGSGVTWSNGTDEFESGDYDIVTVPHDDQTGAATKSYTATAKTGYAFAASNAITGKLDNTGSTALTVTANKDESAEKYSVSVTVPSYGTTSKGTTDYNTVTLTGSAVKGGSDGISIDVAKTDATGVGTLSESVKVTLNITDNNTYTTTPTYKYTVTNGRTASGNVTVTTGEDGKTTYSIGELKYGDHVKVYVYGEDGVSPTYFKVLNTAIENGGFENVTEAGSELKTGVGVAAWRTTASDEHIEVYGASSYGVTLSPNGGKVAELNATEVSSLYQEISTTPGSTLGWTMYHTARSNGGEATQSMAIIVGPTLDATDTDPYRKSNESGNDIFMAIATQVENPVAGETYYTTYNDKQYQVTIASDTKSGRSWKNYSGTYTVPAGQTETVFAFASLGSGTGTNAKMGNLIDGVGFGSGVPVTAVTAAKNVTNSNKLDISINNSTKNGVYVVLDKDMKPVTDKTLTGGGYLSGGNGTFNLSSTGDNTTVSMQALDKDSGPYTVMRVLSGTLSVGSDGRASTDNLTDIATVNIVNFAGEGVTWSAGTNEFESGDYDIVTVPHDDQTGAATKSYTATAKTGYAFAASNAITGKLDNTGSTALTVTANKDESAEKYSVSVTVPSYGTTSKGTTDYNTVTLTGATRLSTGVKLKNTDADSAEMTVTDGVASKTYDGAAVAHTVATIDGATLSYTWQKVTKNADGTVTYTDLTTAPSDAGDYNLKITATSSSDDSKVLGTENLPFTISPKELTVTGLTADSKQYDGNMATTVSGTAELEGVVDDDMVSITGTAKGTFKDANVGTGKEVEITGLSLDGDDKGNYTLKTPITGMANITQASGSGKVELNGWTYGETAKTPTATSATNSGTATYLYKLKTAEDTEYSTTVPTNAGEYTIKAIFPANENYGETTATADFTIAKKTLTATITVKDKTYDGNNSATVENVTLTGMVNGDSVTATASDANFAGVNADNNQTVTATITLDNSDAAKNYTVASTAATTASITAKTLTVNVNASNKAYDGTTTATVTEVTLSGAVEGDEVYLNKGSMTAAFENANVGGNKTVTVTGLTLTGTDAGNYKLPDSITGTANITKATSGDGTVTLQGWTYGETAKTPTATSTTNPETATNKITYQYKLKGADDNTYTDTVPTNAGEYTIKAIFPANDNYGETTATGTFTISKKNLNVNVTVAEKVYNGKNDASVTVTLVEGGIESGDKVELNVSNIAATFDDANAGKEKSVTVTGLKLTGVDASNYTLADTKVVTAEIEKAEYNDVAFETSGKRGTTNTYGDLSSAVVTGGTVGSPVVVDVKSILDEPLTYKDGKLTYKLNGTATENDSATVTMEVTSNNYEDYNIVVTIGVTEKEQVTITIVDGEYTYNGEQNGPTRSEISVAGGSVDELEITYTDVNGKTTSNERPTDAGKYIVTVRVPDSNNEYTGSATKSFEIKPKELTVTVAAKDKQYDGKTDATATVTLDKKGIVDKDKDKVGLNTTGMKARFDTADAGTAKTVMISGLVLDGDAAKNYVLKAPITGTASITVAPSPVTPTPYNGGSSGNTYSWYFNPTPSPVPVAVPIPENIVLPKTGDMTIFQSILAFLGII